MNYANFKSYCEKERWNMRNSYSYLFKFIEQITAENQIKFSYVKNLFLQDEELHLFTEDSLIVAKRFDSGENLIKKYSLKISEVEYIQDWNNPRIRKLTLDLGENKFSYNSSEDCNDDWTSEYAHCIDELALLFLK